MNYRLHKPSLGVNREATVFEPPRAPSQHFFQSSGRYRTLAVDI